MIEKHLTFKVKSLQYDMGGEYKRFVPYIKEHGILFRHSCPYTHNQSGKA